MDLMVVNEEGNYIIQLQKEDVWLTLSEEFSVSAAVNLMTNACIISRLKGRVLSKRSGNLLLSEYEPS